MKNEEFKAIPAIVAAVIIIIIIISGQKRKSSAHITQNSNIPSSQPSSPPPLESRVVRLLVHLALMTKVVDLIQLETL